MPAISWSSGVPHEATAPASLGGEWRLAVRFDRARGWTWEVAHSDRKIREAGKTSSAKMSMTCAERVVAELDARHAGE